LKDDISKYFKNISTVYHLAANADVRFGLKHTKKDINQNIIVTYRILEAMRKNNVKRIMFSSTGSVYGESKQIPTNENAPFPIQTSLYGASKISAEGIIAAYCEGFNFQSYIFRFVSILGPRYSHGHVFDFAKQLKKKNATLYVLGDGNQKKSYLNIFDCINAIYKSMNYFNEKINIINLGTNEYLTVKESIKVICKTLKVSPKLIFAGGKRGWVGDNPLIFLNTKKVKKTGWKPKYTIRKSIEITTNYLLKNQWLLQRKK
jgi:UDP-glucose 4-epimerase